MDQAAAASGRSQSQEAEFRLEQSFRNEDIFAEIIAREPDPISSDLLIEVIGKILNSATYATHFLTGDQHWFHSPNTLQATKLLIGSLFEAFETLPSMNNIDSDRVNQLYHAMVREILWVANGDWTKQRKERWAVYALILENWIKELSEQNKKYLLDATALTKHVTVLDDNRAVKGETK